MSHVVRCGDGSSRLVLSHTMRNAVFSSLPHSICGVVYVTLMALVLVVAMLDDNTRTHTHTCGYLDGVGVGVGDSGCETTPHHVAHGMGRHDTLDHRTALDRR